MSDNIEMAKITYQNVFVVYDEEDEKELGAFFKKEDAQTFLGDYSCTDDDNEESIILCGNERVVELADGRKYLLGNEVK